MNPPVPKRRMGAISWFLILPGFWAGAADCGIWHNTWEKAWPSLNLLALSTAGLWLPLGDACKRRLARQKKLERIDTAVLAGLEDGDQGQYFL